MLSTLQALMILLGIAFILGFINRDFQAIFDSLQPKEQDTKPEPAQPASTTLSPITENPAAGAVTLTSETPQI